MSLTDGSEILFPDSYAAKNLAQGAPFEIRNANGDRLELKRDPQGNLQEIRTPHDHWIKFTYDNLARINRAETDSGHWGQYEYNPDGMLTTAILSSGRQRHYEYEGALMTQISGENGNVLVRNRYRSGLLSHQDFGNGATYSYSYDWPPGTYYPNRVIVTLPDQTTQEVSPAGSVPEFLRNYHR